MKKNVIALAVAAAMAAPLAAQAEVTVSGGLQAELRSVGGDGTDLAKGLYATDGGENGSENGGSYGFLKFSASEDLGGGMKALAMWNGVANVGDSSAAGGITGRDAYVGLTGGFGTVLAGTLATPYKSSTVKWDPFVTTSLQARGNNGMTFLHNGYASNALAYANKFGPATVVIALVLDEGADAGGDTTKTNGEHAKSISINAPVGPVEVAFAYVDASKFSDLGDLGTGLAGASLETATATKLGVKWASGPITVAGQYEMMELGTGTTVKPTQLYVTGSYAMGANTVSLGYGVFDDDVNGTDNATYTAIGVKHAFSKSTSVHAGFRNTDNDGAADETTASVGLRVGF